MQLWIFVYPPTKVGSCIKEVASFGDSLYIIALRKNYVKCFFIFFKIFEIFLKHSTKNTMNAWSIAVLYNYGRAKSRNKKNYSKIARH